MSEKNVVYLISGIGADERAFKYLNINCSEIINIQWIKCTGFDSLEAYAKALSEQIRMDQTREIILIGVSFGGIIAQEIAKRVPCKKVFIISSVKLSQELSTPFKLLQRKNILRTIPNKLFKAINYFVAKYAFGVKTSDEIKLLKEIIRDMDEEFVKWAIEKIAHWKNHSELDNLVHIHGEDDRIFPISQIKNAFKISGGHFMIVNRANEISKLINSHLQDSPQLVTAS